tara:strand:+ start:445 stop:1143 length:699 start_codon:yes stop_codon:yes gene_type:complete
MSIVKLIKNPHDDVSLTIVTPSKEFDKYKKVIESLMASSPSATEAEIIVKIDDFVEADRYKDLLEQHQFKYKFITYPSYHGRYSCQHFYNDMARIASGSLIWKMPGDSEIIHGDWYDILCQTRNTFPDNIYYVSIPMDNGKGAKQIIGAPVVTKEWVDVMGSLSEMPNNDRWLHDIAKAIDRRIILKESQLLMHFPKGRRVLSKRERKELYYPAVEKAIEIFKGRLNKCILK